MKSFRFLAALPMALLLALCNQHVLADPTAPSTTLPSDSSSPTTQPPLRPRDVEVISRVNTRDRVVFITMDDGFSPSSELARVIATHKIPITTFAMPRLLEENASWFLARKRMTFENHTMTHGSLTRRSLRFQKREICRTSIKIAKVTGERPALFRPPGGNFTATTKRALAQCGIKYLVLWSAIAEKDVLYIPSGGLRPGEIILMHFIPSAASTLEKLLIQIRKDGLRPALLRNYLD